MPFLPDDPFNSLASPYFTYHNSKFSCLREAYHAHVFFGYCMLFSGIGAFTVRMLPLRFRPLHAWCGRAYIVSMLWCTGTSLVVHNTGLPAAVLMSLVFMLLGLCCGWVSICVHRTRVEKRALSNLQERIKAQGIAEGGLEQMIVDEKERMAAARPLWERFFSLKTLHAVLMFMSWINMTGRVFASTQSKDFSCHTYPVYKPLNTSQGDYAGVPLQDRLVDVYDPRWKRLPWSRRGVAAWSAQLSVGPVLGAGLVAFLWCYFTSSRFRTRTAYEFDGTTVSADVGRAQSEGVFEEAFSKRAGASGVVGGVAGGLAGVSQLLGGGHNSEVAAQTWGGVQNLDPNRYYST